MISEHPEDIILLDYVEGALRADESESVRRHINTCRACRRTLAEISSTVSELERLPTAELARDHEARAVDLRRHLRTAARLAPLLIAITALLCTLLIIRPDSTGRSGSRPPRPATPTDATATSQRWFNHVQLTRGTADLKAMARRAGARFIMPDPAAEGEAYVLIAPTQRAYNALLRQLSARHVEPGAGTLPVDLWLDSDAAFQRGAAAPARTGR